MIKELLADLRHGVSSDLLAARFHNSLAVLGLDVCRRIRSESGILEVALSGGVWQNMVLLDKTTSLLINDGFKVYFHRHVPTNDGGLALGQAAIAAYRLRS